MKLPKHFSSRSRYRPAQASCCRKNTLRLIARCWTRRHQSRVSCARVRSPAKARSPTSNSLEIRDETRKQTSTASSTENRNGLIVQASVSRAIGTAEREVALAMLDAEQSAGRRTLGADKNYDTQAFVADCRERKVTPHVAQKKHTAIDGRTTRHAGYEISIRKRKQIEECFGWMKDIGLMRKLRHRGQSLVNQLFLFTAAAYNLVRMRRLLA